MDLVERRSSETCPRFLGQLLGELGAAVKCGGGVLKEGYASGVLLP